MEFLALLPSVYAKVNMYFFSQRGFTLVEVAIVMIIIGLLIGGVLKGQEIISNAKIVTTVSQITGFDAAMSAFQDRYKAFPGDMINAENRLPGCGTAPCLNGNGNARLDTIPNTDGLPGSEARAFWAHLQAADMYSDVNGTNVMVFGQGLPAAKIGGGFIIGFTSTGGITNQTASAPAGNGLEGHYVVVRLEENSAATESNSVMFSGQAHRIDSKLDDGAPNLGNMRAIGSVGDTSGDCASSEDTDAFYNEALDGLSCSLAIRIR